MRLGFFGRSLAAAALCLLFPGIPGTLAAGFDRVSVPIAGGGAAEGGVWYPSAARPGPVAVGPFTLNAAPGAPIEGDGLPVVLVSHGTGGWFGGHHDTAEALADAGFVVAALSHPGDNVRDGSGLAGQRRLATRPGHLADLAAFVTGSWRGAGRVDPARIGAFGHSAGGYSAVVAAGAEPDLGALRPHCAAAGAADRLCPLLMAQADAIEALEVRSPRLRIRAVALAAPAPGVVFGKGSLEGVAPGTALAIWSAGADEVLGGTAHADRIAEAWPGPVERRTIPAAGHFVFLAPCPEVLAASAPEACRDPEGTDRAAVHRALNEALARFFRAAL
jgi:predicted dienelactone hydrolase